MRTVLAWLLALACAAWAAMRLFGLEHGFPLVPLVAFTPFVVLAAVAVVVIDVLLRRRLPALVAAVAGLVLVAVVAPRALGGPTEPEGAPGPRLRVLTVNMRYGRGSAPALVALVRSTRADVLSLQEVTPQLVAALDRAGIGAVMPHYVLHPEPGSSGTGLFARVPLSRATAAVSPELPASAALVRLDGAPPVNVIGLHTAAPDPGFVDDWEADMRALPPADPDGRLRILAGDFNATLDHAELRRTIASGYVDAASVVGAGLHGTWPEGRRVPPAVTIDHVLADKRIGVRAVSVHTIPGTDHRAVFAELVLPKS